MKSSPGTIAFNVCRGMIFVLSSLSEKKFVLNAGEKLMQPKTSQKFKNVACFRLLFKIKQPKRLQSTKSVAINTWFLLIKPNFNVKMQRYETNHRKKVVEETVQPVFLGAAVNYQEMICIKWALSLRQTRRGISLQNTQAWYPRVCTHSLQIISW